MAYRRSSARRSYGGRSYSGGRAAPRGRARAGRATRRRATAARGGNTIRLVIEQANPTAVQRPSFVPGVPLDKPKKSKF